MMIDIRENELLLKHNGYQESRDGRKKIRYTFQYPDDFLNSHKKRSEYIRELLESKHVDMPREFMSSSRYVPTNESERFDIANMFVNYTQNEYGFMCITRDEHFDRAIDDNESHDRDRNDLFQSSDEECEEPKDRQPSDDTTIDQTNTLNQTHEQITEIRSTESKTRQHADTEEINAEYWNKIRSKRQKKEHPKVTTINLSEYQVPSKGGPTKQRPTIME